MCTILAVCGGCCCILCCCAHQGFTAIAIIDPTTNKTSPDCELQMIAKDGESSAPVHARTSPHCQLHALSPSLGPILTRTNLSPADGGWGCPLWWLVLFCTAHVCNSASFNAPGTGMHALSLQAHHCGASKLCPVSNTHSGHKPSTISCLHSALTHRRLHASHPPQGAWPGAACWWACGASHTLQCRGWNAPGAVCWPSCCCCLLHQLIWQRLFPNWQPLPHPAEHPGNHSNQGKSNQVNRQHIPEKCWVHSMW